MAEMKKYYLSRALFSVGFGLLLWLTGTSWWMVVLIGLGMFLLFLWAPRSGRYAVHPELGATALRRDEYTQMITNKAARNAFVVISLMVMGIKIYFSAISLSTVPLAVFDLLLVFGTLVYFVSDFWLRKS